MTDEQLLAAFKSGGKVAVPLFDGALLEMFFANDEELLYFADTIRSFLALPRSSWFDATTHVWAYFRDFTNDVGFDWVDEGMQSLTSGSDEIWNFVCPTVMGAEESWDLGDKNTLRKYIVIEGNCGWEHEHGILMAWRDGIDLVRVSDYDGHATQGHAYNDLSKDAWIYYSLNPEMCTRNALVSIATD